MAPRSVQLASLAIVMCALVAGCSASSTPAASRSDAARAAATGLVAAIARGDTTEIAARTGYTSEVAFNHAFKRHVGQPPVSWRREEEASLA